MSAVESHYKQKRDAKVGTRTSTSSSSLSSSLSSSSSPGYDSTSDAISSYSTTPRGGTRIMYDRQFLLDCRNSPLSRSPVQNLPSIPGVTCDLDMPRASCRPASKKQQKRNRKGSKDKRASTEDVIDEHLFQLEL